MILGNEVRKIQIFSKKADGIGKADFILGMRLFVFSCFASETGPPHPKRRS